MSDENDSGSAADDWGAALEEQAETEAAAAGASAADDWGSALQEQADTESQQDIADAMISQVEMPSFDNQKPVIRKSEEVNLDAIMDIPVHISMEIGRSKISIRNLLQLNQGSVVELDRLAGEPLDVLVNGTLIAHGEVVVVNDKYGIRLTDVVSQAERVKRLQ